MNLKLNYTSLWSGSPIQYVSKVLQFQGVTQNMEYI